MEWGKFVETGGKKYYVDYLSLDVYEVPSEVAELLNKVDEKDVTVVNGFGIVVRKDGKYYYWPFREKRVIETDSLVLLSPVTSAVMVRDTIKRAGKAGELTVRIENSATPQVIKGRPIKAVTTNTFALLAVSDDRYIHVLRLVWRTPMSITYMFNYSKVRYSPEVERAVAESDDFIPVSLRLAVATKRDSEASVLLDGGVLTQTEASVLVDEFGEVPVLKMNDDLKRVDSSYRSMTESDWVALLPTDDLHMFYLREDDKKYLIRTGRELAPVNALTPLSDRFFMASVYSTPSGWHIDCINLEDVLTDSYKELLALCDVPAYNILRREYTLIVPDKFVPSLMTWSGKDNSTIEGAYLFVVEAFEVRDSWSLPSDEDEYSEVLKSPVVPGREPGYVMSVDLRHRYFVFYPDRGDLFDMITDPYSDDTFVASKLPPVLVISNIGLLELLQGANKEKPDLVLPFKNGTYIRLVNVEFDCPVFRGWLYAGDRHGLAILDFLRGHPDCWLSAIPPEKLIIEYKPDSISMAELECCTELHVKRVSDSGIEVEHEGKSKVVQTIADIEQLVGRYRMLVGDVLIVSNIEYVTKSSGRISSIRPNLFVPKDVQRLFFAD